MDEKKDLVLNAMRQLGKPVKASELVEPTGLTKAEVDKTMTALKKEGKIVSPKVCFYVPAE